MRPLLAWSISLDSAFNKILLEVLIDKVFL